MLSQAPVWFRRSLLALMVLSVAIRLFYWGYTHRTWEDALIAVLHSENAARGLGLTHMVPAGERPLQGFTSPLGVLVPLVGDLVHPGYGLELIKAVSAFAAPFAVLLAGCISLEVGLPFVLALVPAAFVAVEHHQILWGMAGMETELTTTLYLFSLYALLRGGPWVKGVSLGLLMLARPDAALWVAAFLLLECWRAWRTGNWRGLLPVIAALMLIYGPWLIFATAYYGSPVPNTIVAKRLGYPDALSLLHGRPVRSCFNYMKTKLFGIYGSMEPSYDGLGTGFQPFFGGKMICWLMLWLFVAGAVAAVRQRSRALYVFLLACILGLYLWVPTPLVFGWYTPPATAVAMIGCCFGGWSLIRRFRWLERKEIVAAWLGGVYILSLVVVLPVTFRSDKYEQAYIEGTRTQVGKYLDQVAGPNDTVGVEALGYVGYYSRRMVYDFPGLCSRRVVQFMREYPKERNPPRMMFHLQPTFLVLRPLELNGDAGRSIQPWLAKNYQMVRDFEVPSDAQNKIHGYARSIDQTFLVFRRKDALGSE